MSACGCPGCGGHGEWKAEQAARLEANKADFEAWLAAGKPPLDEWVAMKAAAGDVAYADVAPETADAK